MLIMRNIAFEVDPHGNVSAPLYLPHALLVFEFHEEVRGRIGIGRINSQVADSPETGYDEGSGYARQQTEQKCQDDGCHCTLLSHGTKISRFLVTCVRKMRKAKAPVRGLRFYRKRQFINLSIHYTFLIKTH